MSRIFDAGSADNQYAQLPDLLDEYEGYLAEAEEHLQFEGKTIKEANMENPIWQSYYDQKRIEIKSLVKHFEGEVKRVEGKLFRNFIKTTRQQNISGVELYQLTYTTRYSM